jgi:GR25 family glycosyltransferase involved in LPS biosynthesis
MAHGAIGCYLSHLSILQDALDSGYETIWVMEDDVEVMENPNIISDLIDKLDALVGKGNWDVLFTDPDYRGPDGNYLVANGAPKRPDMDCSVEERLSEKYTMQKVISEDFKKIGARFATHSMIIRRSGMIKLLNFVKERGIFLPVDLENYLMPINRYATRYPVVTNLLGAYSDIGSPPPDVEVKN